MAQCAALLLVLVLACLRPAFAQGI